MSLPFSFPGPRRRAPRTLVALAALLACLPACAGRGGDTDDDDDDPIDAVCGDALCGPGEDCERCPGDCGACAESCYDGDCDLLSEQCVSCPSDCGACPASGGPSPGPGPDAEPDAPPGSEWPEAWAANEQQMLDLVNAMRVTGGRCPSGDRPPVPPLTFDGALVEAARNHALDMGARGYFSHTSLDGRSPWDRIDDAGYTGSPRAENIAGGNESAEATFEQWRNSDGHCLNMMSAGPNEIGVGYARVEGSPFTHYWVQTFGEQ